MTRAEVESVVREAMTLVLDPAEVHSGDVVRAGTPSWDSLKHVELVFVVEDALGVTLEEADLAELDSLTGIVAAVQARLDGAAGG